MKRFIDYIKDMLKSDKSSKKILYPTTVGWYNPWYDLFHDIDEQ